MAFQRRERTSASIVVALATVEWPAQASLTRRGIFGTSSFPALKRHAQVNLPHCGRME